MAFIGTTSLHEANGEVATLYLRQQASWGYVPNYAKVFCHRPELMARWGQLLAEIKRPMDKRRFELVTFVAAHELRNSGCSLAHGRALAEFFSDQDILAIAAGRCAGILTEAEQVMLRFARQVAKDAATVTSVDVEELKRLGFTDADVFDIVAVAAGRAFFTKMLDALGVQPDSAFLAMDRPLRSSLTVGRPIDTGPCGRMASAQLRPARLIKASP